MKKEKLPFIPFCYHLCWSPQNKHYYGVKYGQDSHPSVLWNPYKTSSNYVKQYIEEFGDPDIIEVRKTFIAWKEAVTWENKFLRKINAAFNEDWLNMSNGWHNGGSANNTGRKRTFSEEHRRKLAAWVRSEELRKTYSNNLRGESNPFFGKHHSNETKKKISEKKIGMPMPKSEETKQRMRKPKEEEHRLNLKTAAQNREDRLRSIPDNHPDKQNEMLRRRKLSEYTGERSSAYGKKQSEEQKVKKFESYKRTMAKKKQEELAFYIFSISC